MKEKFDKRLEEAFDDKTGLIDPATVKGTLRDIVESDFPDEVKSIYLDHVIKMYDKRINKFLGERKEKKTPKKSKGPSKLDLIKQITASISDMAWSMMVYQKVLSRKLIDINMDVFTGKLPADNISEEEYKGVVN